MIGAVRFLLTPLLALGALLYGAAVRAAGFAYRKGWLKVHRLAVPVVSVGNLTWGGTGKTPLVIHLGRALRQRGRRVAVLTRGYGADETALLKERLSPVPVLAGADRVASGLAAIRNTGAEVILLDDGYQQWRLKKDLEILTVDAASAFGNGRLIPWGCLREPPAAAGRADVIVLTRADLNPRAIAPLKKRFRELNPRAAIFTASLTPQKLVRWRSGEILPCSYLAGKPVCTLAGIAGPRQFERTVENLGAVPALRRRAMDHHPYRAGEMAALFDRCRRQGVDRIVTTAKDAVRIPPLLKNRPPLNSGEIELLVLEVELKLDPDESELLHRIDSLLAGQGS